MFISSQKSNRGETCIHTNFRYLFWVGNCFVFSPNLIMDLEAPARSIQRQHLLAKSFLALFSRDIALLDVADSRRGRAFVQVLHELAQRVLVALCFAGDLKVLSVALPCGMLLCFWTSIRFHHFRSSRVRSISSPQLCRL